MKNAQISDWLSNSDAKTQKERNSSICSQTVTERTFKSKIEVDD